jgi:Tol biopolymer transport system component
MKIRILLTLAFSALILFACTTASNGSTPPAIFTSPTAAAPPVILASPTEAVHVPTQTVIPPTSTPFSEPLWPDEKPINPGIYPVYWRGGEVHIVLPSGKTQVLIHLYDKPSAVSSSGDITYLVNRSRNTKPSPDGKIIVYMNMEDGFLYNYDITSKTKRKILQPDSGSYLRDWSGSWSPDGKYILYAIDHGTSQGFPSIYITNNAQNTFSRITNWNNVETEPVWSPDYQWIAFTSDKSKAGLQNGSFVGATDIFVVSTKCVINIETCKDSFIKQLTNTGTKGDVTNPSWNPNSSNLGFIYINGQTGDQDICLVDLNGNVKNLTNTPDYFENVFSWSPDGEKLVLRRSNDDAGTDLFILNISDGVTNKITNSPETTEGIPYWSPDGKEIAFQENVDDPDSGISLYSVKERQSQILTDSHQGKFLFWLTVFPEISSGVTLTVSPSGQDLNIRAEASTDSPIMGKLQRGDELTIMEQPLVNGPFSWWKIKSNKAQGWIGQNYHWYLPNP